MGLGAAPFAMMPFAGAVAPLPPPVVVVPGPTVVGVAPSPAPVVVAQPSDPLDPVALAAQRMQSFHAGSRREGAQTLGRLGDPRGIPPLVDALKHDSSKDVRIASAVALGEIGGHEAEVVLSRCIVYEKKEDVRVAAAGALRILKEREAAAPPPQISAVPWTNATRSTPAAPRPRPPVSTKPKTAWLPAPDAEASSPFNRQVSPEPSTESPSQSLDEPLLDEPLPAEADRTPPPPPTPVVPE